MAATTMATAAGAVVLLYYVLVRRMTSADAKAVEDDEGREYMKSSKSKRKNAQRRPAQAPATWLETISTLSETLRFTYSETLGKWPIGDLAFGINYLLRRQGNVQVASVYAGENSIQLTGPEIVAELKYYLQLLTLCILFSKKPFPVFLESAGYSEADVLLQKPKAGILKPAFTIICDKKSKCFLLLIRGTHSIKDTLTAATGGVVPFHHSVLHDGGISNLILGYAHCGMVAAARWIAKLSIPFLLESLKENPGFEVKVVGHSLGGGTAALLTYILREHKDLSSISCITFAPAACMTWELAESGKHFITTIINGSDLVPTFSTASIDDLRTEVTASSWLNDLRDQVEQTRVLNVVFRSATALVKFVSSGSCPQGDKCHFNHDMDARGQSLRGVCFEFLNKGKCERGEGCSFKHSLQEGRSKECWFCLSSPNVESHLITSVGENFYCALAKGPLVQDHVLILPIEHLPNTLSSPPEFEIELVKFQNSLKAYFKSRKKEVVFFEWVYLKTSHANLQAIPIPSNRTSAVKDIFNLAAEKLGFKFMELKSDGSLEGRRLLRAQFDGKSSMFYVELPGGIILSHTVEENEKFPVQFGREVLAGLLNMADRADWRNCKLDKEEEIKMVERFKSSFQEYDPNQ